MLLDCRKGSILFFSWWFHGAGFSGRPEGRGVAIVGPPVAPLHLLTATPSGGGVDGAARGHAERREFSGLLLSVLLSFTVFVRRAVGQSPSPLFTPSVRNENHRTFLGQGESLSCLPLFAVVSQPESSLFTEVSHCLRFPNAGHCTELSSSHTCWLQSPGPAAAFVSGTLSFAWSHASTVQ